MRIRGGSGLGDAMYLRPIAEHFQSAGEQVTVCNDYPDVFLGSGAVTLPFDRFRIDVLAHYTVGKSNPATNQWQDICRSAGIDEIPLRFAWQVRNHWLVDVVESTAAGRPIVLVHGGRTPMGRTDGFGQELLPEQRGFDAVIEALAGCFTVRIGKGDKLYPLHVDVDLNNGTSVSDLLDLGWCCDGVLGQCSFAIPLAEAFDKPLLVVWAARGMAPGPHAYIRQITPRKVLSKPTSGHVVDDWPVDKIQEAALTFRDQSFRAQAFRAEAFRAEALRAEALCDRQSRDPQPEIIA